MAEAVTRVVVLSPTLLHREAWRALLSAQPGILVAGVTAVIEGMGNLVSPYSPSTVLSDLPAQSSEAVHLIKSSAPTAGVLCLVHSYDLAEIIGLLQAGANAA